MLSTGLSGYVNRTRSEVGTILENDIGKRGATALAPVQMLSTTGRG
jgi:hypothetical protein